MYPSLRSRFRDFNKPFEGAIPYMYDDIKGLVTVGIGNLIDPVSEAVKLPFQFKNRPAGEQTVKGTPGARATPAQITAEWQRVKDSIKEGGKYKNSYSDKHYATITDLELSSAAIDKLVDDRLMTDERGLKSWSEFAQFDQWPADAQLALLSMAWAIGPYKAKHSGFTLFKSLRDACAKQDFLTASATCTISSKGNAGVIPRNKANASLFANAAVVVDAGASGAYQRATLYYPRMLGVQGGDNVAPAHNAPSIMHAQRLLLEQSRLVQAQAAYTNAKATMSPGLSPEKQNEWLVNNLVTFASNTHNQHTEDKAGEMPMSRSSSRQIYLALRALRDGMTSADAPASPGGSQLSPGQYLANQKKAESILSGTLESASPVAGPDYSTVNGSLQSASIQSTVGT